MSSCCVVALRDVTDSLNCSVSLFTLVSLKVVLTGVSLKVVLTGVSLKVVLTGGLIPRSSSEHPFYDVGSDLPYFVFAVERSFGGTHR